MHSMRCSRWCLKVSNVAFDELSVWKPYSPRYAPMHKLSLSSSFDRVTEENRFLSMEILFSLLSGYAGRRQYPLAADLRPLTDKFKSIGLDWHHLKCLDREDLSRIFQNLEMPYSERIVVLQALERRVCGVLCQSSSGRHSSEICLREGKLSHGWRCGLDGHVRDTYFEGKATMNPSHCMTTKKPELKDLDTGIKTIVHSEPDFSVVGRFHEVLHPRIWTVPNRPQFLIDLIGYEFRVHPTDPRASLQIERAEKEWQLHGSVIKLVLWEMLETFASARDPQPLDLQQGEVRGPDSPLSFSRTFNIQSDIHGTAVEHRMQSSGGERPWFTPPLPQRYADGIPVNLPYSPSVIIYSSFREIERNASVSNGDDRLYQPVMDVSVYVHPKACFFWSSQREKECVAHILTYAKRMPYALPFYLYFRVDTSRYIEENPSVRLRKDELMAAHQKWFDLHNFCESQSTVQ